MQVDSTSSTLAANTAASTPAVNKGSATRDQFLRLFVAQLEHQNPLDPQSGADMVAQLAQFSTLEQQVQTNQKLTELTASQDASGSAQLATLVGKTIKASASTLQLDGAPPPIEVSVPGPIASGSLVIRDANGAEVRRLALPAGRGPFVVPWDGTNATGTAIAAGTYTCTVEAKDATGADVAGTPTITAVLDALELASGATHLRLGHATINPADVLTIGTTEGTTP